MTRTERSVDATASEARVDAVLSVWDAQDAGRAVTPADCQFLASARGARALVVERALDDGRELFHACAVLGRWMAAEGASPTLAAETLDSFVEALDTVGRASSPPPWILPARAALAEGYVAGRLDKEETTALRRWDYPGCAVPLGDDAVAIAAGHPTDDTELLGAWAARVASGVVSDGYRRARISGSEAAIIALARALELGGVDLVSGERPSLSWLPWLRPDKNRK